MLHASDLQAHDELHPSIPLTMTSLPPVSSLSELEASLLSKWKDIEALEGDEDNVLEQEFTRSKEAWFGQAFRFLQSLPLEEHCWCGHYEITWPLLELFYYYFTDSENNSCAKFLWQRFSREIGKCTQCVLQYYKAKEMYATDFLEEVASELVAVLTMLDEERVSAHLQEILHKMQNNSFNSEKDSSELICVLFEVMRFPMLLDDAQIDKLFGTFLQNVENTYELTLATDQFYPGVYALFFHTDQTTRGIALRLASSFGKLRVAADLEPIQRLLGRHIQHLEFDLFDQKETFRADNININIKDKNFTENRRARSQFTKESLWIGLKTLLGMLEPAAFEEGIIERYPSLLSIVLNHASESTPVFWNALYCLKLLLEVLGYKLWIKTTFSPELMRSSLIGQCFHTHEEKMHKAIFDLFQPYLQSLEALQDGEYEKQRRIVLYFLLQQVSHSRNFSSLMRKKARQIAFHIITRGFKMVPASPPMECAHVWGPPLLESVKDTQLYDAVRKPAIHLLETIIIADSVVLASLQSKVADITDECLVISDDDFDDLFKQLKTTKLDSLSEYKQLDKLAEDWNNWLCAPIFWVDILAKVLPSDLPESFSQAITWSTARMSLFCNPNDTLSNDLPPIEYPEVISSRAISCCLTWEMPRGCDDGADGRLGLNVLKVSSHGSRLFHLLKRCTATFFGHFKKCNVVEKWIWDPSLAEAVVLLSLCSNEIVRNFGRYILSHFAGNSSFDAGLMFLYGSEDSAICVNSGIFYAARVLMMNRFEGSSVQHLLFIACKLLKLWPTAEGIDSLSNASITGKEGGFIKEHAYAELPDNEKISAAFEGISDRKNLQQHLSSLLWPLLLMIMRDGRQYAEDGAYTMAFSCMFDLLPLVFENVLHTVKNATKGFLSSFYGDLEETHPSCIRTWIFYFISWGEVSVASIYRRWKEALISILNYLREKCFLPESHFHLFKEIQSWLSRGAVLDSSTRSKLVSLLQSMLLEVRKVVDSLCELKLDGKQAKPKKRKRPTMQTVQKDELVIISDDEDMSEVSGKFLHLCRSSVNAVFEDKAVDVTRILEFSNKNLVSCVDNSSVSSKAQRHVHPVSFQKQLGSFSSSQSGKYSTLDRYFGVSRQEKSTNDKSADYFVPSNALSTANTAKDHKATTGIVTTTLDARKHATDEKSGQDKAAKVDIIFEKSDTVIQKEEGIRNQNAFIKTEPDVKNEEKEVLDSVLKELVETEPSNALKCAPVKSVPVFPKKGLGIVSFSQPRRQIIQLQVHNEHLKSNNRRSIAATAFPPPRLDEWYKRILSLDYFSVVGVSSEMTAEALQAEPMLKVPLTFRSSQHYMDVFRPLVLEEFKAQLQQTYDQMNLSDGVAAGALRLMSLEKVDDFEVGRFTAEAGDDALARACFENDLLLFSRQPFQDVSQAVHTIGKVEKQEKDNSNHSVKLVVKFFLRTGNKRLVKVRSLLLERSKWYATRLMSITPQIREFQALSALERLPLLPIILNAKSATMCPSGTVCSKFHMPPDKLMRQLKAEFNYSQLQSIEMALRSTVAENGHELTLVQGPPGTGKTRTIVGIISALIASIKYSKQQKLNTKVDNSTGPLYADENRPVSRSVAIARSWQVAALAREQMHHDLPEMVHGGGQVKVRILVCAQSNAAVDELVARICKNGLYDTNGGFFQPFVVRVGNVKTVHVNSLPVFIDTLVEARLGSEKENTHSVGTETDKNNAELLRSKLHKIVGNIQMLEGQLSKSQINDNKDKRCLENDNTEVSIKVKLNSLYKQRREVYGELAVVEANVKRSLEEDRNKRQLLKKEIIQQADIVIATLSGCGGDVYSACFGKGGGGRRQPRSLDEGLFDAVVIDEAAQALEPATLIPLQLLKHSQAKCVMVGDPKQLPATVLSQMASKFSYECSMFERLQRGGLVVSMLNIQYRMHPEICRFPSEHFYENQLQNGLVMEDSRKATFHESKFFGPYVVFDVIDGYERVKRGSSTQSLCNEAEIEVALEIFRNLKERYPNEVYPGRIGVITPYQKQLSSLRESFYRVFGRKVAEGIEFNTVDAFQGREIDILIFSTVRATARSNEKPSRIGFVADVRRMNVALTRARFSLWVVCNATTLQGSSPWAALLEDARKRGILHSIRSPYTNLFNNSRNKAPRLDDSTKNRPDDSDIRSPADAEGKKSFNIQSVEDEAVLQRDFSRSTTDIKKLHSRDNKSIGYRAVHQKNAVNRKSSAASSRCENKHDHARACSKNICDKEMEVESPNSNTTMEKPRLIKNRSMNKGISSMDTTDMKDTSVKGIHDRKIKDNGMKNSSPKKNDLFSIATEARCGAENLQASASHLKTEGHGNNSFISRKEIRHSKCEIGKNEGATAERPSECHRRGSGSGESNYVHASFDGHATRRNVSEHSSRHKTHHQMAGISGSATTDEFLNTEWKRFQKVLSETKILFPLTARADLTRTKAKSGQG